MSGPLPGTSSSARQDWKKIPTNHKIIYGGILLNIALLAGIGIRRQMRKSEQSEVARAKDAAARAETQDFRCYYAARLYRQECAYLDPTVEGQSALCQKTMSLLKECRDSLYDYITVDKTPAMMPTPELVNKPPWLP
eukprot:GDKI01043558.1.p1 GENE.GDKI01043558.1~~GDKI01043558.1.p1  ORF type:complete len:137 (+),score=1.38 GDKI01043558.1:98-508(+)